PAEVGGMQVADPRVQVGFVDLGQDGGVKQRVAEADQSVESILRRTAAPAFVYGNLGLRVWPRKFERCGQEERATPAIRENSSLKQPNFKEESPRSAECGPD